MSSGSKSTYSPHSKQKAHDATGTSSQAIKKVISTVHRTVTHINSEHDAVANANASVVNRRAFLENNLQQQKSPEKTPTKSMPTTPILGRSQFSRYKPQNNLTTNEGWSPTHTTDATALSQGKYFRNIVSNASNSSPDKTKAMPDNEINVQMTQKASPTKSVKLLNSLNVLKSNQRAFSVTVNVNGANEHPAK